MSYTKSDILNAVTTNNVELVKKIITKYPMYVNIEIPMYSSSMYNYSMYDDDTIFVESNTLLSISAMCGHTEICKYLIKNGADINNPCGESALYHVIQSKNYELLMHFIECGADLSRKDILGMNGLDYAKKNWDMEAILVLLPYYLSPFSILDICMSIKNNTENITEFMIPYISSDNEEDYNTIIKLLIEKKDYKNINTFMSNTNDMTYFVNNADFEVFLRFIAKFPMIDKKDKHNKTIYDYYQHECITYFVKYPYLIREYFHSNIYDESTLIQYCNYYDTQWKNTASKRNENMIDAIYCPPYDTIPVLKNGGRGYQIAKEMFTLQTYSLE